MCGICGFTGKLENREDVLKRMTAVITHRGPDSEGFYADDSVNMGFRRLSIIDLDSGHQPIYNEDKTLVLTFNGEIYNYKELRAALIKKGHKFATETYSEVLVHGFEEWKEDLLLKLRGMFGFAIYNTVNKSLFLARDFFGIKPMHYAQVEGEFVYGSEIKSILEYPKYEKRFNKRALDTYLSFQYAVPPQTFFEDIFCLWNAVTDYLINACAYTLGERQCVLVATIVQTGRYGPVLTAVLHADIVNFLGVHAWANGFFYSIKHTGVHHTRAPYAFYLLVIEHQFARRN